VQQLVEEYREEGRIPQLTKRRRQRTDLTEELKEVKNIRTQQNIIGDFDLGD